MNLNESKQMLAEAERTGAVKIMIPASELKYMLQVEEMQKALKWYADGSNWGSIEEYGVFISDGGECARKTLQSMKGATS